MSQSGQASAARVSRVHPAPGDVGGIPQAGDYSSDAYDHCYDTTSNSKRVPLFTATAPVPLTGMGSHVVNDTIDEHSKPVDAPANRASNGKHRKRPSTSQPGKSSKSSSSSSSSFLNYDLLARLASTQSVSSLSRVDKHVLLQVLLPFCCPIALLWNPRVFAYRSRAFQITAWLMCLVCYPLLLSLWILAIYKGLLLSREEEANADDGIVLGQLVMPLYSYQLACVTAAMFAANTSVDEVNLVSEVFGLSSVQLARPQQADHAVGSAPSSTPTTAAPPSSLALALAMSGSPMRHEHAPDHHSAVHDMMDTIEHVINTVPLVPKWQPLITAPLRIPRERLYPLTQVTPLRAGPTETGEAPAAPRASSLAVPTAGLATLRANRTSTRNMIEMAGIAPKANFSRRQESDRTKVQHIRRCMALAFALALPHGLSYQMYRLAAGRPFFSVAPSPGDEHAVRFVVISSIFVSTFSIMWLLHFVIDTVSLLRYRFIIMRSFSTLTHETPGYMHRYPSSLRAVFPSKSKWTNPAMVIEISHCCYAD